MHESTLSKDLRDAIKRKSEIWRIGPLKKNSRIKKISALQILLKAYVPGHWQKTEIVNSTAEVIVIKFERLHDYFRSKRFSLVAKIFSVLKSKPLC